MKGCTGKRAPRHRRIIRELRERGSCPAQLPAPTRWYARYVRTFTDAYRFRMSVLSRTLIHFTVRTFTDMGVRTFTDGYPFSVSIGPHPTRAGTILGVLSLAFELHAACGAECGRRPRSRSLIGGRIGGSPERCAIPAQIILGCRLLLISALGQPPMRCASRAL